MRAVTSTFTVLLAVPLAALSTQVQPTLESGKRVRVTAPLVGPERMVGIYLSNDDSTMQVQTEAQVTPLTIPLVHVIRLEMSQGRKSNSLKGLVIGSVSGAVLGAVAGLVVGQENGDNPCGGGRPAECAAIGALAVGATGALVGLGIGALIKTERWERVRTDQLRVQPVTTPDGRFGLAASVRF